MVIRLFVTFLLFYPFYCVGNEGLWLPIQLKRLQWVDLQKMGLQLTSEEIYSINSSSLKDAIVSFNGNCTAEIISKTGLLLTNHHCGYQTIQQARLGDNFLINGFWAGNYYDEIPDKDIYVSFLVRMEDVTKEVLGQIEDQITEKDREERVDKTIEEIVEMVTRDTHYNAVVKTFFSGNEYYLFIYETYKDVRLVGVPPESIGRFGGETDNWEWPRYTGDFALFRVYTALDGNPSEYSPTNVPLKSSYHLPISLEGVQEGDFTLVMGYPAKTKRHLTSLGVKFSIENTSPHKVKIIRCKKNVLERYTAKDPEVKLNYSSRYRELSNLVKYYQGQIEEVRNFQVIKEKEKLEEKFKLWCRRNTEQNDRYSSLFERISKVYMERKKYNFYNIYLVDAVFSSELLLFAYHFSGLNKPLADKYPPNAYEEKLTELKNLSRRHFRNYHPKVDQEMTAALVSLFYNSIPKDQHPEILKSLSKNYNGDFSKWSANIFKSSMFSNPEKIQNFLSNPHLKTLTKDPAYMVMRGFLKHYYGNIASELKENDRQLNGLHRLWMNGLQEMHPNMDHYSDANGTLRISWGKVQGYQTSDDRYLPFQTTLSGLMNKQDLNHPDYQAPEKLHRLYQSKDYGIYGQDGIMSVAFITDNDISGGNSGSPVLNSRGALVGIAFDGNRESLTGDYYYNEQFQRSINVDIRYVLFIIDHYAGAKHLIDEMTLVKSTGSSDSRVPKKVIPQLDK